MYKYDLDATPEKYLDLWKWFSEDTAKIKDKMWTMAAFFYTILGALLGFMAKAVTSTRPLQLERPALLLFASLTGMLLSGYGMYMLWEYGSHIRSGWDRTDYLRKKINGLSAIWYTGNTAKMEEEATLMAETIATTKKGKKLPAVARRLIGLLGIYLCAFIVALLVVVIHGNQ